MSQIDFSVFSLDRRIFYSLLLLVAFMYPGHNQLQTLNLTPGTVKSYTLPEVSIAPYPVSDAVTVPYYSAFSVVIQDVASKSMIYSDNPDVPLMPASTTKIMTALVALDNYKLDDVLTITTEDRAIGSTMELIKGEQITVENLLYGLLVHSGNDAALALAEHYPGGYDSFVEAMNAKAKSLHLDHTSYKNPSGVESYGHLTTARDLGVLAATAVQNEEINKIMQTKLITVNDITETIPHHLENTNELLGVLPGVKGLKTGWTEEAGECLVVYAERDNHPVISVVLKSADRFGDTSRLINWVYAHHTWEQIDTP